MSRFIDVNKVREEKDSISKISEIMFCDICGDTKPKHGFYPLYHYPSVSGITCNRCRLSDEEYISFFGENKGLTAELDRVLNENQ